MLIFFNMVAVLLHYGCAIISSGSITVSSSIQIDAENFDCD